jgi:O-antigen/teichoic acid export membrane protein
MTLPPGLARRSRAGRVKVLLRHPVARLFASMVVVQGSLFLSGTLLVRGLGVGLRGELALVSAFVGIGAQVGLLGLPAAIVYFVSSRGVPARTVLRRIARWTAVQLVAVSVLATGGLVLVAALGEPLSYPVIEPAFVVIGTLVFTSAALALAGLQGEQRFTAFTVLQALPILLYAVLVAALFVTGLGNAPLYLAASSLGWLVVPILAWRSLRRGRPRSEDAVAPSARQVTSFGRNAALASASPTDLLGIDQVLIGATLGHHALGLYVVGWAFETATVIPGAVLAGFVAPRVAAAPPDLAIRVSWLWVARVAAASVVICLAVEAVLPTLMVLAFGESVRPGIGTARILVAAGVFLGMRRFLGVVLQSLGRPRWSTWAELASLVTMVGGVLGLGAAYGVRGAATAMALAGVVGTVVQLVLLARVGRGERVLTNAGTG